MEYTLIETLSVEETTEILREKGGLKISPATVRKGIEQGVFPFGDAIKSGSGTKYTVYKTLFDKWYSERI